MEISSTAVGRLKLPLNSIAHVYLYHLQITNKLSVIIYIYRREGKVVFEETTHQVNTVHSILYTGTPNLKITLQVNEKQVVINNTT